MAIDTRLPEGTDGIVAGASASGDNDVDFTPDPVLADKIERGASGGSGSFFRDAAATLRGQATEKTADLRGQATDRARDFAEQGKDRATSALENVAKLIGDTASQVDDKVGAEYGDYARRAADAVNSFATTLRDKDVDSLFADGREIVRRSPMMAASAAAVIGFALVRLIKAAGEVPSSPRQPETSSKPTAPDVSRA